MSEAIHPTRDEALTFLAAQRDGAIGSLVLAYPGAANAESGEWLEEWFVGRALAYNENGSPTSMAIARLDLTAIHASDNPTARGLKLLSLQPHYFRGFKTLPSPISFDDDLVVVDGRNSSGKTSLAEALEWLLTGSLSRRELRELGNPRELENCIGNQLRPEGEQTWVTATFCSGEFGSVDNITLKRVLLQDYGNTGTSRCESSLFLNDSLLDAGQEAKELEKLFTGVSPLLMQHTLRQFVESSPSHRREYFERLLRLDELTDLIVRAVLGDARLEAFPSPQGNLGLTSWEQLSELATSDEAQKVMRTASRAAQLGVPGVKSALCSIAHEQVPDSKRFAAASEIHSDFEETQDQARRRSYPLLSQLRTKQQASDTQGATDYLSNGKLLEAASIRAIEAAESAAAAVRGIGRRNLQVAQALKVLRDAGLVQNNVPAQHCPLCDYAASDTLHHARLTLIDGWVSVYERQSRALQLVHTRLRSLLDVVRTAIEEHDRFLPQMPTDQQFETSLSNTELELKNAVTDLRKVRQDASTALTPHVALGRQLRASGLPNSLVECRQIATQSIAILTGMQSVQAHARRYREALQRVELYVAQIARTDPHYRFREAWLTCFKQAEAIAVDFNWEASKRLAQRDLETIREELIEYRKRYLEARRASFNTGIQEIWSGLRKDEYSVFRELHIPEPRGRGFPIEIEVKALLDDGTRTVEVDALRVFSESQANALGIAAFITRSTLVGHQFLVFDDPVQSMDEEHFRTFARDVIPQILSLGFQLIILTHNDSFARDISYWHHDRQGYRTMLIRHSRRRGCIVDEGNRRVAERLKAAEKRADEGQLDEGWKVIRLALERLYTVAYLQHGPADFRPESWSHHTAESMWNAGAGTVIDALVPEAGKRLKEILNMTVGGTHDGPAPGETDLRSSISYLRPLLGSLRVGG